MDEKNLHRDSDSPPWGSQREALTQGERVRLFMLLHACLVSDLVLAFALTRAFV